MASLGAAAIVGIVSAVVAAGASITSTVLSNNAAKKSQERQINYLKETQAQEAATAAEEKRLSQEAQQRQKAYGASLLNTDTLMNNMYSNKVNEQDDPLGNSSLLVNELSGMNSVRSIFA